MHVKPVSRERCVVMTSPLHMGIPVGDTLIVFSTALE